MKLLIAVCTLILVALSGVAYAAEESISLSAVSVISDGGQGSGVVIGELGLVVTNLHVIQEAKKVAVVLQNGDVYQGVKLVSQDPIRDIAILKFDAFDLSAASMGNSNNVGVGDRVRAIGSPTGLTGTVTAGIVSAIRSRDGTQLIQIDAAISPGSSGGGVFDSQNKLVGITVGSKTEAQNINFAIPINYVRALNFSSEAIEVFESWSSTNQVMSFLNVDDISSGVSNTLRSIDEAISVIAEVLEVEPDAREGFTVFIREDGGNITARVTESGLFIAQIAWDTSNRTLADNLFQRLLELNYSATIAKVGISSDGDLWIGYENFLKFLQPDELRIGIASLVDLDEKVFASSLANSTETSANKTRKNFKKYRRKRGEREHKIFSGKGSLRLSKDWILGDEENNDDGITTTYNRGANWIRIIDEPTLTSVSMDGTPDLIEATLKSEENDDTRVMKITDGIRNIDGLDVYWAVYEARGQLNLIFEYNVYPSKFGFLQTIAYGLNLDSAGAEAIGDEIIQTLKVK